MTKRSVRRFPSLNNLCSMCHCQYRRAAVEKQTDIIEKQKKKLLECEILLDPYDDGKNEQQLTAVPLADALPAYYAEKEEAVAAEAEFDTDTIVVGNGPAGIALSAMLSGFHPFYDGTSNPHPNAAIHEELTRMEANGGQSLLFEDLSTLADLSITELNSHLTPFAALYDSLVRPSPSAQSANNNNTNNPITNEAKSSAAAAATSCLSWQHCPTQTVPHIVLGDTQVGGSWTGYEDEMTTVSVSNWMDLPGFSVANDFVGDPAFNQRRPNARTFKHYLLAYCMVMGIDRNFRPFTRVTQMQKFCHQLSGHEYWEVRGVHTLTNEPFTLRSRNVVLACGQSHPRLLGIVGESQSDEIAYELRTLKRHIARSNSYGCSTPPHPVIVVGDGISAADAVLCCLNRGCPVLHVFRRNERQLRNIMLSRLSPSIYPEYARVYQLMMGKCQEVNYRRLVATHVLSVSTDQQLTMQTPDGIVQEKFRSLAVCIGKRAELPFVRGSMAPPVEFTSRYQSTTDDSLFAIGALTGDHFVRYLVGGALCVAQTLLKEQAKRRETQKTNP